MRLRRRLARRHRAEEQAGQPPSDVHLLTDMQYDPDQAPDPALWLALGEDQRLLAVARSHRDQADAPAFKLHVCLHSVVETQLAEGLPAAHAALERLQAAGVPRHEAVHAIGDVLSQHLTALMQPGPEEPSHAPYFEALARLNRP